MPVAQRVQPISHRLKGWCCRLENFNAIKMNLKYEIWFELPHFIFTYWYSFLLKINVIVTYFKQTVFVIVNEKCASLFQLRWGSAKIYSPYLKIKYGPLNYFERWTLPTKSNHNLRFVCSLTFNHLRLTLSKNFQTCFGSRTNCTVSKLCKSAFFGRC